MSKPSRSLPVALLGAALVASVAAPAGAHGKFDHPAPGFGPQAPISTEFLSGGEGAEWELHTTIVTGNPHTDLDFFTSGGDMYVSVGTLAIGPNAGGQTIVRLTNNGEVEPDFVAGHPSAACLSNPSGALGLQHDVEATPKGDVLYNADWGDLVDRTADAQLLIDATDAGGRCHDQGPLGLTGNPQGGLEIIDITDVAAPVEIGLTSHIGQAHTVNVDPSRPHIAYAVTSTGTAISPADDPEGTRANESGGLALDGFEVVDLSSCMNFSDDATVQDRRDACQPEVYRLRFELGWTRGTFDSGSQSGCHELELHPGDILTCAGVEGTLVLDMSRAFDAFGQPRGTPLPCRVRPSSSLPPFTTGAMVTDCVVGEGNQDLSVAGWLDIGAPSLEGVELVGFVNHGGRDHDVSANHAQRHTPDEDIAVSHEAELTHSGKFLIVSDERGGAVVPPDASCPVPGQQPEQGNGGIHAFAVDRLHTEYPAVLDDDGNIDQAATAAASRQAYASTPDGEPAIYRALPRVPAESQCTAHVFQQIPGQNRIFMGWYTQGTQVVDYVENDDGTFEWHETGFFIPLNANQWVSHVFQFEENEDGTFTYWGVSADFVLTGHGRNAIEVYKVTLPPPLQFAPTDERPGPPSDRPECDKERPGKRPPHCDEEGRPGPPPDRPGSGPPSPDSNGGTEVTDEAALSATTTEPSAGTRVIDLRDPSLIRDETTAPPSPAPTIALLVGLTLLWMGLVSRPRRRSR